MRRALLGIAGLLVGVAAGWYLPKGMIRHPHEFDYIAILGWQVLMVPLGAILGLLIGLSIGKPRPERPALPPQSSGSGV